MIISLIAALADNRVIGNKNKIPWRIKEDLVRFRDKTLHHSVIMGRTTFDSLIGYYKRSGRPLPDRRHIIVSRDTHYTVDIPGCFVAHSVEEALSIAKKQESAFLTTSEVDKSGAGEGEIFVAGGASIFEQTIGKAGRLHLTLVHGNFEGDTYFPDYSQFNKVVGKEDGKTADGLAYTFLDLER